MTTNIEPKIFPALHCYMGDWEYFVTSLTFSDINQRIKRTDEVYKNKGLSDMLQRALGPRTTDIATYLVEQQERFFNAIVVGVYQGAPDWYPVDVLDSPVLDPPDLDERTARSLGLLRLSGEEQLFAIDGQHRVEGIKKAVSADAELGGEEIAVIFVAHKVNVDGIERTRRLFTTLNKTAVKVSNFEIVALDEDDAFAITTRRLVEDYDALSPVVDTETSRLALVHFGRTQIPANNNWSITTILTIFDVVLKLALPIKDSKQRSLWRKKRPSEEILTAIYQNQVEFWEALRRNIPEMAEALGSDPRSHVAGKYRTQNGGHVLFRPAGLHAFSSAVRVLLDRGYALDQSVHALSNTVLELNADPWKSVLWDGNRKKMITKNKELAGNLFLHMVNQEPHHGSLLGNYRKALGDDTISLDQIPQPSSI